MKLSDDMHSSVYIHVIAAAAARVRTTHKPKYKPRGALLGMLGHRCLNSKGVNLRLALSDIGSEFRLESAE